MKTTSFEIKNKLKGSAQFKISRFKEVIKKTKPHTHEDYYELIFISEGQGFHWIEADHYRLSVPEMYFLKPGQLHCWQFTSIPKGFVVLFKEGFFDPIREVEILELIRSLNKITRVQLSDNYQPAFLFEEMLREYQQGDFYSTHVIHGYLRAIFSKLLQLSDTLEETESRPHFLHERFLKLLSEKCPNLHKVSAFSALLYTSQQNLNAACRKYTSKSASEHITERLILEAKRYILHTDKNINEIADILHFNDASYFVKFFKKQEGLTPLQFRESHFQ